MGKLDIIRNKIERRKNEIINLKVNVRKERKKNRTRRKEKLINLGTLFLILNLLEEEQNTILGFLFKYKKLNLFEKEKFIESGENILLNNNKQNYSENLEERKIMFYKMIRKSALLEKLKIHLDDPKMILGYLNTYKDKSNKDKEEYTQIGINIFNKVNKIITDEQKLEILRISTNKRINITKLLKEKYKKNIHLINESEYLEIINIISN